VDLDQKITNSNSNQKGIFQRSKSRLFPSVNSFPKKRATMQGPKIYFNAPFSIGFSLLAVGLFGLSLILNEGITHTFGLYPSRPDRVWTFLSYSLVHGSFNHLLSNLSFLLLLGPLLEEKYGSKRLLLISTITVIVTGVLHVLFFSEGLIGGSGLVFLFIVLSSFGGNNQKGIPVSFILIAVVFLGKELWMSVQEDNISQFAHLVGGFCGAAFGIKSSKT
jgi:rhomboid protease GluP